MGYATNVVLSIFIGMILYVLTEKIMVMILEENKFNEKVQKSFIIGFIIGLLYIALGLTVFSERSQFENQTLKFSFIGAGIFLILNSVFFNWNNLDEETKIIMLGLTISGMIIYSYGTSSGAKVESKQKKNKIR